MAICKNNSHHKNGRLVVFILLLLIGFAAINIGFGLWGTRLSLDLTSSKRFTLDPQTVSWLKNNQQPLYVRLYISPALRKSYPGLAQYAGYVIKLLEYYQNLSVAPLNLEIVEPQPFNTAEKEAQNYGIRGFLDQSGRESLYFGATIANDQGESYTIPYFEPQRQNYLEHDLSRIFSKLSGYKKPLLGIISAQLPIISKPDKLDTDSDWPFIKALREDYDLEYISADKAQIPLRIKTLLVVNPQSMPAMGIYALDQYLMRGGNVILFLDPFSEAFLNTRGFTNAETSGLADWLKHAGLVYQDRQIVGDQSLAAPALLQDREQNMIADYPLWLVLKPEALLNSHPIINGIQNLRLLSAGGIIPPEKDTPNMDNLSATVLASTGDYAASLDASFVKYSSKSAVNNAFKPGKQRYALAVLLEGYFSSYFKEHPLAGTDYEQMMFPFLIKGVKSGRLLVVTDSDILYAPNWTAAGSGPGVYDTIPLNNNFDFVERSIDYMTHNDQLLNISPRYGFSSAQNIGRQLQKTTEASAITEINRLSALLRQTEHELEMLQKPAVSAQVLPQAGINRKVEMLRQQSTAISRQLQEQEYLLREQTGQCRNRIIILNLVVFPLLLILILVALNRFFQYRQNRRAWEITHE